MTKGSPKVFRKKSKALSGRKYPGAGKKMLPNPKPKPMTIKEIERELKQKKQRQHGPRIRGRKAVT